jgi:hypothetical protein
MSRLMRLALQMVPDEPDQVARLRCFRAGHPGVSIYTGQGYWQARIPQPDGETVITRYFLRELLDKLDTILSAQNPTAGPAPAEETKR